MFSDHGAALRIADSTEYSREKVITAKFTYFRYHGRHELFAFNYSKQQLKMEANKITSLAKKGIDVYAFFNNDAKGHAVQNALTLQTLLADMDSSALAIFVAKSNPALSRSGASPRPSPLRTGRDSFPSSGSRLLP